MPNASKPDARVQTSAHRAGMGFRVENKPLEEAGRQFLEQLIRHHHQDRLDVCEQELDPEP